MKLSLEYRSWPQASYVGDSALYSPATILYTTVFQSLVSTYLDQALPITIMCLCVLYLHSKDTSPAPSKPYNVSISPVKLRNYDQRVTNCY